MSRCKWEQLELDSFQNVLNKNTETCLIAVLQLCTSMQRCCQLTLRVKFNQIPMKETEKHCIIFTLHFV